MSTKPRSPAQLRRQRFAQIDRAYSQRLRPRMSKAALAALNKERDRQIALTRRAYAASMRAQQRKTTPRPKPKPKKVSHAKKVSRFWQHFARDGTPVPPWEIEVGPGRDIEDQPTAVEGSLFVEEDYGYEEFDTDWGGYEYEDTGYPDENT